MVFMSAVGYFAGRVHAGNIHNKRVSFKEEDYSAMRRFLLIAAAGAIVLVGLSANQCGSDQTTAPATPPAETTPPATPPAEAPATPEQPAQPPQQ